MRDAADANDTGSASAGTTEAEKRLLAALPKLPILLKQSLDDQTVIAEAPYTAASGRTCRAVHVAQAASTETHSRLACSTGGPWFFVPDVFGGPRE